MFGAEPDQLSTKETKPSRGHTGGPGALESLSRTWAAGGSISEGRGLPSIPGMHIPVARVPKLPFLGVLGFPAQCQAAVRLCSLSAPLSALQTPEGPKVEGR